MCRLSNLNDDLTLALLPTATLLVVTAFAKALNRPCLLFASLASYGFIISVTRIT